MLLLYYYYYYAYYYGILIWGGSMFAHDIFKCQKQAVRILGRKSFISSCRKRFVQLNILTVPCLYILEILTFVQDNPSFFNYNSFIHICNTRSKSNLHQTQNRLILVLFFIIIYQLN